MSTENPVIRPFTGLGPMEELASRVRLKVTDSSLVPVIHLPDATHRLATTEIAGLGLALEFDWTPDELAEAARQARVPLELVHLYVIFEDSFLKERHVFVDGLSASEVPTTVPIASRGEHRVDALANRLNGFEIHVALVLAAQMDEVLAFRPHRKGTKLASATFTVRSERNSAGLDPKPLDADTRSANNLPASTVLFVDCDGPLIDQEDLAQTVSVYVHEQVYTAMLGRGPERTAIVQQLAIDAWAQIIHALHDELTDDYVWDGTSGAGLRMLWSIVKGEQPKTTAEQLIARLRSEPRTLCAIVSGAEKQARLLLKVLGDDESKEGEE